MAVGFKSGSTDLDDIFVRLSEFTGSNMKSKLDGLAVSTANLDADTLGGTQGSSIRCSNGCSWNCSTWCKGSNNRN